MDTCFVIQPFDKGQFDKRFTDDFAPAIEAAGLQAYRVDRDPSVSIPINDIESGIRDASICLADITTDNPNVWFELGYALAIGKHVCLICSTERSTRLPFDIQHRHVIKYEVESSSDFKSLRAEITKRLKAAQDKDADLKTLASIRSVSEMAGLTPHEAAVAVSVMCTRHDDDPVARADQITQDLRQHGFTDLAARIGIEQLLRKELLVQVRASDDHGWDYTGYRLTDVGIAWILDNQDSFKLRADPAPPLPSDPVIPF